MVAFLTLNLFLMSTVVLPSLHQGYFTAKAIVLVAGAFICSMLLIKNQKFKIVMPFFSGMNSILIMSFFLVVILFSTLSGTDSLTWAFLISGLLFFLTTLCLDQVSANKLRWWFFSIAVLQALVVATQQIWPGIWQNMNIGFEVKRSSGLVGNREFLATFLSVGLLFQFPYALKIKEEKNLFLKTGALLILAVLWLIQSKGTLLLLCLVWGRPIISRFPKICWAAVSFVILSLSLLSQSIRGRFLIWIVGLKMGLEHLPLGVGTGNFGKYYLSTLGEIFARFPILRTNLGDSVGVIDEAHNFVINSFAEMGLLGLVTSLFIFIGLFRIYKRSEASEVEADHGDGGLILLLMGKLTYTVVLLSPVSIASLAIGLGLTLKNEFLTEDSKLINDRPMKSRLIRPIVSGSLMIFMAAACLCLFHFYVGESLYSHAYKSLRSGEMKRAKTQFENLTERYPHHSDAWLGLAFIAVNSLPTQDPGPFVKVAMKLNPDFNTLKISAKSYLLAGDCYHAQEIYKNIHMAFPQHLSSISGLAQCALSLGDKKSAAFYAQLLIKTEPRVPTKTYGLNLLSAEGILEKIRQQDSR